MKNKILSVILIATLTLNTGMSAMAAENPSATKSGLHSSGSIHYFQGEDGVVIDSDDFYTLADRLDLFKVRVTKQLGAMHTYLTKAGGGISLTSADGVYAVHTRPYAGEEVDPLSLDFATILEGIAVSQSIPADPASYGMPSSTKLYKTPEGRLTTTSSEGAEPINIQAASADNLSAGTAAWVNGKLLLGTGADMADNADAKGEETQTPGSGSEEKLVQHGIASGYTVPEEIETAVAFVYATGKEGNQSAPTPSLSVNGGGTYYKLCSKDCGRYGYNVKVAVYYLTNIPAGAVIKGTQGLLFC